MRAVRVLGLVALVVGVALATLSLRPDRPARPAARPPAAIGAPTRTPEPTAATRSTGRDGTPPSTAPSSTAGPVTLRVDQQAEGADDGNPGTRRRPLQSIGRAAELALEHNRAGVATRIVVAAGTYREGVSLELDELGTDADLTIEAAGDGEVVVSGADVWNEWTTAEDGIAVHAWTRDWGLTPLPDGWEEWFADHDYGDVLRRREMVVIDGRRLRQVLTSERLRDQPGTYLVDEDANQLLVHPPEGVDIGDALVEVAVRDSALSAVGWSGLTVSGLTFRHTASSILEFGATVRRSSHVLIEDATFVDNNWGGLAVRDSTDVVVRRSSASRNGVMGYNAFRSAGLLFDRTESSRNNWRGDWADYYGWDAGGGKFFSVRDVEFRRHVSVGNLSHGLWLDTDNADVRVVDSLLADNRASGVFLEAIQGPIEITGTTVCGNGRTGVHDGKSNQVTIRDSRVFGNAVAQVAFFGAPGGRPMRAYDTGVEVNVQSDDWRIENTLLATDDDQQRIYETTLPWRAWERVRRSLEMADNLYVSSTAEPFVLPQDDAVDLTGWQQHTSDQGSRLVTSSDGLVCNTDGGAPLAAATGRSPRRRGVVDASENPSPVAWIHTSDQSVSGSSGNTVGDVSGTWS